MTDIEDKLLIWKFRRGSGDALCRIYEKYKGNLLKIASGLLNDTAAAEDIVHDTFLFLGQSAQKLRLDGNLKNYLATCVANRVRNLNKAARRQGTADLGEAGQAVSRAKRPEQWIVFNEQLKRVNDALEELPYEQREVVILHVQGGLKFRAIAESQGVSINTVQSRYRYGLDKLRSILDSEVEL
ncbi:MAG TPA: sigma-70 family RNA polymerase sigma factor [Sedimentisphaerales bacterium]|nr:sigma-70 family RNA polymerase sigma factor [Sedimentisphaerales bacterium]